MQSPFVLLLFMANDFILYSLKTLENLCFFEYFQGVVNENNGKKWVPFLVKFFSETLYLYETAKLVNMLVISCLILRANTS